MKAIILAAGRGKRMADLTDDRPKCLVELNGRPLIEWQLDALRKCGIETIGIVTGYKREMLASYELFEFHNPRWSKTQMVSSLMCAHDWLERDVCIVTYSDIFYEHDAIQSLVTLTDQLAITYDPNWQELWSARFADPLVDAESFRLNKDGTLAEIGNKPSSIQDIQGQYMGILRISPLGWRSMRSIQAAAPASIADKMQMTGLLQKCITQLGCIVRAIPYTNRWGEMDSAQDLKLYEQQ
jgi:choline kinase